MSLEMAPSTNLRVLIVDDEQLLREGVRCILESKDDIEVVGESGDGKTAIDMSRLLLPDVVVMDVSMPGMSGLEATRQLKEISPAVKVVGLSVYSNNLYVVAMLEAGASGYVLKSSLYDELYGALKVVGRGETYLSPGISGAVIDAYHRDPSAIETGPRAGGTRGG